MLILQRKRDEAIVLDLPDGVRVRIVVLSFHGDTSVRLGIEAPRDVPVFREELLEEMRAHREGESGPGND